MKSRALVMTSRYPYPVLAGDQLRIYHICRALASRFDLTLLSFCYRQEELEHKPDDGVFSRIHRVYLPRWRSWFNTAGALLGTTPLQLAYYRSREYRTAVQRLLPDHDLVLAHLIRTAQYVDGDSSIPRILEMTDAMSMSYARMNALRERYGFLKLVYRWEQARVERYERAVSSSFDQSWLVSAVDAQYLAPDLENVRIIPNGVDSARIPYRDGGSGKVMLFIGNMRSVQNQDACFYFVRQILPRIRRAADVRLRVAGSCPDHIRRHLEQVEAVEVTGQFQNIAAVAQDAFCGVCPIRAGAGIKNKMLDYMALGLPAVASIVGAEGIEAVPGRDMLVYSNEAQACDYLLRLYRDPDLRASIAAAALQLVQTTYSWARIYDEIADSAESLVHRVPAQVLAS